MRITQSSIAASTLANLQLSLSRGAKLQEQLSSGKVISKPSDSPTGTVSALSLRSKIADHQQYAANAADGAAWLGTVDATMQSVNSRLQRVRELTLTGSTTGAMGQTARQAIATEVTSLRDDLMSLANTQYAGRPIFGGTTAGSTAFSVDTATTPTTYPYVGTADRIMRRLDAQTTIAVDASGAQVFGQPTDPDSMFALLDRIADHVVNDPASLSTDLGQLDTRMTKVLGALTDVGVRASRVDAAITTSDDRVLAMKSTLSGIEDIDLPKTIMDVQLQNSAYQAALSAAGKVLQPSLMDFLR
jgi:flagellar hook-associated protein 3 FlgL